MAMSVFSKKIIVIILAIIFFLSDRLIKLLFVDYYNRLEISVFGDLFKLKLALNPGIAFGLPLTGLPALAASFLILIALAAIVTKAFNKGKLGVFAAWAMLTAGALSNFADRLNYGSVVDYFDLAYFSVFNLSDMAIVCSAIYLIFKIGWKNKERDAAKV